MDNRKIEQIAVNAVVSAFINVENVLAEINENDKTECIDGYLQLYSSKSFTIDKGGLGIREALQCLCR